MCSKTWEVYKNRKKSYTAITLIPRTTLKDWKTSKVRKLTIFISKFNTKIANVKSWKSGYKNCKNRFNKSNKSSSMNHKNMR